MYGYWGKLLRIDLTDRQVSIEDIPEEYLRDYIGGAGLAARYLYEEIPVDTDVFDGNNKLFFSVGPLNGSSYPTSGRCNISCRSPLTGIWLDSSFSGRFGHNLKRAGFDAMIIQGISSQPVYICINDQKAEVRDASHLWGLSTSEAIAAIAEETDAKRASSCVIGQAGESLVKMACIVNERGRTAGRGGAGALMGSKRLKGISVFGDLNVSYPEQPDWQETIKAAALKVAEHPLSSTFKDYGTGIAMAMAANSGDTPTKNWQLGTWDKYLDISGIALTQTILRKSPPKCHACPINCARYVEIEQGPYAFKGAGPEYETLASFGSLCLNNNLESIAYANMLCNEYGMDTISTGSAAAFALEAFDKKLITVDDTDGLELTWGNADAILALVKMIAFRDGLGNILAEGVREASRVIGSGSEDFAVHVKGLELPMHDPRAYFGLAATYATSPRGGCHCHGYIGSYDGRRPMPEAGIMEVPEPHAVTGKGQLTKAVQDYSNVIHASIICLFSTYSLEPADVARAISAATGLKRDVAELFQIGERIFNLQRAFNNRFGVSRQDDILPKRVMTSTIGGANEGLVPNLDEQLEEYYEARGWEADGRPGREKLMELGLGFVIKDLYK